MEEIKKLGEGLVRREKGKKEDGIGEGRERRGANVECASRMSILRKYQTKN